MSEIMNEMTNEEAIEYNKNLREYMRITDKKSECKFLKENYEALDMAIKALETIPKYKDTYYKGWCDGAYAVFEHLKMCEEEQSGDLISRQAVLDLMRSLTRWCVRSEDGKFNNVGLLYDDVMFGIDKLPPANPQEPKTGHWEWIQYDYNPKLGDWYCSECRCVAVECVYKNEKAGIPLYKYCPQCGAKMVEPQESEDKCKNCKYYRNPDYTRCHKCKAESEGKE